jgi:hypothetical protein
MSAGSIDQSYIDDTGCFLTAVDLPWFIRRLQELGPPIGLHLNLGKTKILTSTTGQSPIPRLPRATQECLEEALNLLGPDAEFGSWASQWVALPSSVPSLPRLGAYRPKPKRRGLVCQGPARFHEFGRDLRSALHGPIPRET